MIDHIPFEPQPDDELPETDLEKLAACFDATVPVPPIRTLKHRHNGEHGIVCAVGKPMPTVYGYPNKWVCAILEKTGGYYVIFRSLDAEDCQCILVGDASVEAINGK